MRSWLCVAISPVLLSACTAVPVDNDPQAQINPAMGRSAIVIMGTHNLDHNKPSTLSWLDDVEVVGSRDDVSVVELQQQIQYIVQGYIVNKGYPVVPTNGDFQLHVTLVLGNDKDRQQLLRETGGIDPGLAGADKVADKGSLIIELKQGRALRWRGAVQIYLLPEYDVAIARQRIEYAVTQLLQTWP